MSPDVDFARGVESETIALFSTDGEVDSVRAFIGAWLDVLPPHEATFLRARLDTLAGPEEIPTILERCLIRSEDSSDDATPVFHARRSGVRSAYFPDEGLQLKGCRPDPEGRHFPIQHFPFGASRIVRDEIPFGVMTIEAVLREVLGYCFMRDHELPFHGTPVAVMTYRRGKDTLGHAVALRVRGEDRVESHVEDPGCTVRDLIGEDKPDQRSLNPLRGSEVRLRGINVWNYVERKARFLAAMHRGGGFRGILNSNLGNDVLLWRTGQQPALLLGDFDSFAVVPMPPKPDEAFLDSFALHCLIEVIAGSLPILQYVDLPAGSSHSERADALGAVYFTKSSLWQSYQRRLLAETAANDWDTAALGRSLERARRTEACVNVLSDRVLSAELLLREAAENRQIYRHN